MKDKHCICKACFAKGLSTSGLNSLLWAVGIDNISSHQRDALKTFFPLCPLLLMVSSACLPRALAKRKSDARLCPLKKQQPRAALPSWLRLDPGSLWASGCTYGEGSSPGIAPAGNTKLGTQQKQYEGWPQSAAWTTVMPLLVTKHTSVRMWLC